MNDAMRMCIVKRTGKRSYQKCYCLRVKCEAMLANISQIVTKGDAVQQLHNDIGTIIGNIEIEDLYNVWMAHRRDCLGFSAKASEERIIFRQVTVKNLDSNRAI